MRIIQVTPDIYDIPLPAGSIYPNLRWETDLKHGTSDYEVVEVPLKRFIELCKDPAISMKEPASDWPQNMRDNYINGQNPTKPFAMPRIGFSERPKNRSLFEIITFKPSTIWAVGYTNGRHRVRIAEYLGAEYIPVQIHKSEALDLKSHLT